ncbi:MAG: succinate dehydrogenase, cytochrome b556 subunit [Elusimicrobia bacterium]|nr:succinate dehydrogenase, cytochrome b556 subunit [Elusimicrobiota bacterium]
MYRGGVGQFSYLLHRVTGVGILLFLLVHIADTALICLGPGYYNRIMALYAHPVFKLSEVALFAAVLFHALNGIRVFLVDFWERGTVYHKKLFYLEAIVFFVVMVPVAYKMVGSFVLGSLF